MNISDLIDTNLEVLKTTYVSTDSNGDIVEHAATFPIWIFQEQSDLVGSNLFDLLPEFVGQEDMLEQVKRGEIPFFRLENINRTSALGETRYYTLIAMPAPLKTEIEMIILMTDTTDQGEYLQQLMQNRNELRITQQRMADLTYRMDYILRHYVAPELADALLNSNLQPELGGELLEVSALFADIRAFTPLAEQLPPEHLVPILNGYLDVVGKTIEQNDGSISQFQGDNVVAIFNMFGDQPDHALQAVQAGIDLQQAIATYQKQRPAAEPRLHFGVGINTGMALIGNVGAQRRYSYTAIGDTVNLAARITGTTPAGEVWVSQATQQQLQDRAIAKPLDPVSFKGKSNPTSLFQIIFEP